MSAFFVKGDDLSIRGPEWARDPERPFYTASRLEWDQENEDFFWCSDQTIVTDAAGIAFLWALVLAGVVDDGENPRPLARVVAHRTDPCLVKRSDGEVDPDEERVVAFISESDFVPVSEPEGKALSDETLEYAELIKIAELGD